MKAREAATLQTYREYSPTGFDTKGLNLADRQDWLVVSVGRNRDSSCLSESNFATALKMLGGESETVEVHRFGHWACGWLEIILVKPNTPAHETACEIDCSMASYPVLDEMDLSEREHEAACKYWLNMSLSERVKLCQRFNVCVFSARFNNIPEDADDLYDYLRREN